MSLKRVIQLTIATLGLALPSLALADGGLLNISGLTANVAPAVCANVLATGSCAAATNTNVTAPAVTPGSGGGGLVNVSNTTANVNPAVCANVLANGNCAAATNATTTGADGGGLVGGLINIVGTTANVNPAVCANVLANANCAAATNATTTATGGVLTGGPLLSGVGSLINLSGTTLNLNPALCANILSSGLCSATTNSVTTTTGDNPGRGGGSAIAGGSGGGTVPTIAAAVGEAATALPRTGSTYLAFLMSLIVAAAAYRAARQYHLQARN